MGYNHSTAKPSFDSSALVHYYSRFMRYLLVFAVVLIVLWVLAGFDSGTLIALGLVFIVGGFALFFGDDYLAKLKARRFGSSSSVACIQEYLASADMDAYREL